MSKDLEIYKFCQDKLMEWQADELSIWIEFNDLKEFTNILGYDYFCEDDFEVILKDDCVVFDLVPICSYFGIYAEDILTNY